MSAEHDRMQLWVARWAIGAWDYNEGLRRTIKRIHGVDGWHEISRRQDEHGYWIGFERTHM